MSERKSSILFERNQAFEQQRFETISPSVWYIGLLWQFLLSLDPDNSSTGNSFIASLHILGLRYAVVVSARYVSYHKQIEFLT